MTDRSTTQRAMTGGLGELPRYHKPPVNEVVLAVSFEPLPLLNSVQFLRLWTEHFPNLPRVEEQPPYAPPVERFGRAGMLPNIRVALGPGTGRYWFVNPEGTELVQIQRDWFARNWRKVTGEDVYPHFDSLHEAFERDFNRLEEFIAEAELGDLRPTQCEVTYINTIDRRGQWDVHGDAPKVFTVLRDLQAAFLPSAEDETFGLRFLITRDADDRPLGRLNVQCQPAYTSAEQDEAVFVLNLTARGAPLDGSTAGVHAFMRIGHEWIVRGFTDLTTAHMHAAWERYV